MSLAGNEDRAGAIDMPMLIGRSDLFANRRAARGGGDRSDRSDLTTVRVAMAVVSTSRGAIAIAAVWRGDGL